MDCATFFAVATARATITAVTLAATMLLLASATRAGAQHSGSEPEITRLDGTHFRVSRRLVDRLLAQPDDLTQEARFIMRWSGGRAIGVELRAVRRGSLAARLGFRNRDVVRSVNGHDATSSDAMLAALRELRIASRASVSVLRGGTTRTFEYSIGGS